MAATTTAPLELESLAPAQAQGAFARTVEIAERALLNGEQDIADMSELRHRPVVQHDDAQDSAPQSDVSLTPTSSEDHEQVHGK